MCICMCIYIYTHTYISLFLSLSLYIYIYIDVIRTWIAVVLGLLLWLVLSDDLRVDEDVLQVPEEICICIYICV